MTNSTMPIMASIVLSGIATFMINPFLALELMQKGQSAGQVGLILGVLSGFGLARSSIIGRINARFGSKPLSVLGMLMRAAGLLVFLFETNTVMYVCFAIIASLGSAAANLGVKTELMRQSTDRRLVVMRSIAVNAGALVGPAVGAILYLVLPFDDILLICISAYVLLAFGLLPLRFKPPEDLGGVSPSVQRSGTGHDRMEPAFVMVIMLTVMYWLIYSQWSLVVPLSAYAGFGVQTGANAIYIGNAVFILAVQYPCWCMRCTMFAIRRFSLWALRVSFPLS
ncbi:MFS transporter [Bifidobacterium lemurum]|nr:MFS transporter [Bifidobacterium lemurum]